LPRRGLSFSSGLSKFPRAHEIEIRFQEEQYIQASISCQRGDDSVSSFMRLVAKLSVLALQQVGSIRLWIDTSTARGSSHGP
jgi:hypothetical protein